MKKSKVLKIFGTLGFLGATVAVPTVLSSCSPTKQESNPNIKYETKIQNDNDKKWVPLYENWYKGLTYNWWNVDENGKPIDAISTSEVQSLDLYTNAFGHFWNAKLHNQEEDTIPEYVESTVWVNPFTEANYKINGDGWKYINSALKKATMPEDVTVYHGVEWMETKIYDQLKGYIKEVDSKKNYDDLVGKTFNAYGLMSTTFDKNWVARFTDGEDWTDNNTPKPPFNKPTMFKINIKKNTQGIAYVSGFNLAGQFNNESQLLINMNSSYKINSVTLEQRENADQYENPEFKELLVIDMDLIEAKGR